MNIENIGVHCIGDLWGCPEHLINDKDFIVNTIRNAIETGMATLIGEVSYQFDPQGVTALALIAESHIAVHTWPEKGFVALDVFTCGDRASAEKACEFLVTALQAEHSKIQKITRGGSL